MLIFGYRQSYTTPGRANEYSAYKSECGLYFKPMHLLCFPIKNKPKTKARLQLNINYAIYTTVDKTKLK